MMHVNEENNGLSNAVRPLRQINRSNHDNYVTILAIYDDQPNSSTHPSDPCQPTVIAIDDKKVRSEGVVEITNLEEPPSRHLKVITDPHTSPSTLSPPAFQRNRATTHSVDFAAATHSDKSAKAKLYQQRSSLRQRSPMSNLARRSARESKIPLSFVEARERLEEKIAHSQQASTSSRDPNMKRMEITLGPETAGLSLGIEISAVPDPNPRFNRLLAVEVRHIDQDGRVALDGRIKIGDQIVEVNYRPVYQMSLPKAQARLRELDTIPEPMLIVLRQVMETDENAAVDVGVDQAVKPIKTALQQANTTQIGSTKTVEVTKGRKGFQFGVKSRMNAANERLFYINNIHVDGPASGKLEIGDRLLKINDVDVGPYTQAEVVDILKQIDVGETAELYISRVVTDETKDEDAVESETKSVSKPTTPQLPPRRSHESASERSTTKQSTVFAPDEDYDFLTFGVELNDTRTAGLGIILKGGKLYPDKGRLDNPVDYGLFVKRIAHGSACYRDGRFLENDKLIGIEELDLRTFSSNAEALEAFSKRMSSVPLSQKVVHIHIARRTATPQTEPVKQAVPAESADVKSSAEEPDSDVAEQETKDSFSRAHPNRKSISEKRPFGGNDASNLQTYLTIKHKRQTSGIKGRSQSHEPIVTKMQVPDEPPKLRKASFTPAPSFRSAMTTNSSKPSILNELIQAELGPQALAAHKQNLELRKKEHRKTMMGTFTTDKVSPTIVTVGEPDPRKTQRMSMYTSKQPPPYEGPHRHVPPPPPPPRASHVFHQRGFSANDTNRVERTKPKLPKTTQSNKKKKSWDFSSQTRFYITSNTDTADQCPAVSKLNRSPRPTPSSTPATSTAVPTDITCITRQPLSSVRRPSANSTSINNASYNSNKSNETTSPTISETTYFRSQMSAPPKTTTTMIPSTPGSRTPILPPKPAALRRLPACGPDLPPASQLPLYLATSSADQFRPASPSPPPIPPRRPCPPHHLPLRITLHTPVSIPRTLPTPSATGCDSTFNAHQHVRSRSVVNETALANHTWSLFQFLRLPTKTGVFSKKN